MKQGAYLDRTQPYHPYMILLLDFAMNNMDKEDEEGAYHYEEGGFGWTYREKKEEKDFCCRR